MAENTVLNPGVSGDTIATEEIANENQQGSAQSPPTPGYKVPRSKIAVGPIDIDLGDASDETPSATRDRRAAEMLELILVELQTIREVLASALTR